MFKQWAYDNGLGEVYEQYVSDVADLREYYGSHTDDLELAISQLEDNYPELFDLEEDEDYE